MTTSRVSFKVWVLRPVKRPKPGDGPTLNGHIFLDEHQATAWINQEYVRGHYRLEERTAHRASCSCGRKRIVLESAPKRGRGSRGEREEKGSVSGV